MRDKARAEQEQASSARSEAIALRTEVKWYHFVPVAGAVAQIVNEFDANDLIDEMNDAVREGE